MQPSKFRTIILSLVALLLVGRVGYELGQRQVSLGVSPDKKIVINQEAPPQTNVDFSLFWNVWQRMFQYYIDAPSLDPQKMVWGAINGMVAAADDPYTTFLPPKENKEFKEEIGGAFEGIGAQLEQRENRIVVVAPLKGTPAEKAGLLPGDIILKVDDEDAIGWTVQQAVAKIRGERGTSVTLNVLHDKAQAPVDITITRGTITVPSVESWTKDTAQVTEIQGVANKDSLIKLVGNVAYLRLNRFGDHTNDEWNKAVGEILATRQANKDLKGLVLDLRNNPGGYLQGAVFVASEFINDGVVVSQQNSDGTKEDYRVERRGRLLDLPIVVLVNKGSASASEIVAGALRDHKRATIIGDVTFGKGSVQTPQELPGGASLHVTTGKWLLPNGDWIHKKGITPDVLVPLETTEASRDAQLAKAIELLLQ